MRQTTAFGWHPAGSAPLLCTTVAFILLLLKALGVIDATASRSSQPRTPAPLIYNNASATSPENCMAAYSALSPQPVAGKAIQLDRFAHAAYVTSLYRTRSRLAVENCGIKHDIVFVPPRGGLGDRFRGMVQLFYYALLSDRGFALDWSQPYRLTDFFDIPSFARSEYGQSIQATHTGRGTPPTRMEVTTELFQDGHDIRGDLPMNASVAIQSANHRWTAIARNPHLRQVAIQYGLIGLTREQLFRLALDVLILGPRPAVVSQADAVLAAMGMPKPQRSAYTTHRHPTPPGLVETSRTSSSLPAAGVLIGIQVRTGSHGASWQSRDPPRHSLGSVACFAAEVVRDCQAWKTCYVVFTSDSDQAASLFREHINNMVQDIASQGQAGAGPPDIRIGESYGEIMHVYRRNVDGRPPRSDEWLKTMVDWYLLRQSDALILSRSGFGWVAAWAGATVNVRQLLLDPESDACAWYHLPSLSCRDNLYLGSGVACN